MCVSKVLSSWVYRKVQWRLRFIYSVVGGYQLIVRINEIEIRLWFISDSNF